MFTPLMKQVVWGGDRIGRYKRLPRVEAPIGESWEISALPGMETIVSQGDYSGRNISSLIDEFGEDLLGIKCIRKYGNIFPLLVKIIDAHDNLSVQVHPDDNLANKRYGHFGKTEMWYIISANTGAKIYAGLKEKLSPEEYDRRVADGSFMEVVSEYDSFADDVYLLPGGSVHAIGAGNLLAEIQQATDITYRIYDYNRLGLDGHKRELHTSKAKEAIDFSANSSLKLPCFSREEADTLIVECEHFNVRRIKVSGEWTSELPVDTFKVLMCISGKAEIECMEGSCRIREGETVLLPAAVESCKVAGNAVLLYITL